MTRKEAMRFVRASGGGICIRYVKDPVTNRPLFADHLFQVTRRAPGLAAGVMTASIALSTAAYAQEGQRPASPPTVVTKASLEPIPKREETKVDGEITQRQIETLPTEKRYAMMGDMVTVVREIKNPLMRAVQNEDIDEVKDLIAHGSDVNGKEDDKTTPLFAAVETGDIEIVRTLLDFGAKINARDKQKQTPLMRLDDDAKPELLELLLRAGAKIDLTDKEGNTALILVAGSVTPEVLKALIDAGADVNLANNEGQTALMNAANRDNLESVRHLLLAGAKVNVKNKEGDTAWDLASEEAVEDLLVSFGADVKEPAEEVPNQEQTGG
ncbi:MAG: ankyrin repeat domain-containing protein [Acidobacteriota bacterium]